MADLIAVKWIESSDLLAGVSMAAFLQAYLKHLSNDFVVVAQYMSFCGGVLMKETLMQ
jgi:hypothetical protein